MNHAKTETERDTHVNQAKTEIERETHQNQAYTETKRDTYVNQAKSETERDTLESAYIETVSKQLGVLRPVNHHGYFRANRDTERHIY